MTIGYQIINLGADGAEVLAKVKAALASKAPILLVLDSAIPFWACNASVEDNTATVNGYLGATYLTATITSEGVSVVENTVAFEQGE